MFAPALLAEPPVVSSAVLKREAELLARDGQHHVGEAYFRHPADAVVQRRWQAELEVRAEARISTRPECAFCHDPLEEGEDTVTMAGDIMHRECARVWDDFANGPTDDEMSEIAFSTREFA